MKILVVSNYYYPEHKGGVETVSFNLVKYYRAFGETVRWVAADVHPIKRKAIQDDVPIPSWNFTEEKLGFPHPIPNPFYFVKIIKNVLWCDVIHLQDCLYQINIFVFFAAKLVGKPVLITQYAKKIPYAQRYKRILQDIAYHTIGWVMFSMANKVVFITKNVRDNMNYINPEKLRDVVNLGVDTNLYMPMDFQNRELFKSNLLKKKNTPLLLFVGRMVERKGIHLLKPLVGKYNNWHWVFVGRADDMNPSEWGYKNLTHYPASSDEELRRLYSVADLLLHPSTGEGITLIAFESMASGTPVAISEESLYELDESDRDLFISFQRQSDDIEKSILQTLSKPQSQTEELRKKCREYSLKRLSWKKMSQEYLDILRAILIH